MTMRLFMPEWQGFGGDRRVHEGAWFLRRHLPITGWHEPPLDVAADESPSEPVRSLKLLARHASRAQAILERERPHRTFLIGGTCGCELAPISYLNRTYPKELGVLWFDAHGDLNTPDSSPSSRFHGMILRTLLGEGASALTSLIDAPLASSQVTLLGTRDLDPEEQRYVDEHSIDVWLPEQMTDVDAIVARLRAKGLHRLYLHLDVDCFDAVDFPHVLMPTDGGPALESAELLLTELNNAFDVVGMSIVEYVDGNLASADRLIRLLESTGLMRSLNLTE